MLFGRFGNTSGAPYLEGAISIPDLGVRDESLSFMVDTGASRCMLGPPDVRSLGIDLSRNDLPEVVIHGVSGRERCLSVSAYLAFTEVDHGRLHYYEVQILISKRDNEEVEYLPSVLGRDILNQWTMHYIGHNPRPSLTFELPDDGHVVLPLDR